MVSMASIGTKATVDIFISHSHEDDPFCRQLVAALRRTGADVWYDEHNLEAGHLIQVIDRELRRRPVFLVILSPAALASRWVQDECTWAYSRFRRDPTRIILPILAAAIDEDSLWDFLQDFKRIEASGMMPLPTEEAVQCTLRALALDLPGNAPASGDVTIQPQLGVSARGEDVEETLALARAFLAQHRYGEAKPLVEQAVELAPDSFEAWASNARVHDELRESEPALEASDRALRINPQSAVAWASRAGALWQLKRFADSLTAAEAALGFDADDAVAWYVQGSALDRLDRYEEALGAYAHALALDPMYAYAWNGKGNALSKLGRYEEALAAFEQRLVLDPESIYSWAGKGGALYNLGCYEEALAACEHALTLDPKNANAWDVKAETLKALKRPGEADKATARARELRSK